jgi:hypothetical protein
MPCTAQALSSGADFLRAEIPARPAGMAGAFAAFHDDASAFLWNPAASAWVAEPVVSATHFNSVIDTSFDQASFVQPLEIMKYPGGLAFGLQYSSTANLTETDLAGNDKGAIANHDFVFQAAYGLRLGPGLALGAGLKGFSSQLAEFQSQGAAVDLGFQSRITERVDLGISFLNLGSQSAYDQQADPLPSLLRIALKGVLVDTPEVMLLAGLEADRPMASSDPVYVNAGAEYWLTRILVFRAGWRFGADSGNLTLGAGVKWYGLGFDYAYVSMGDLGISHRFSISAELGKVFEKAKLLVPELNEEGPPPPNRRLP